jgi:TPR repeat protein
LTLIWFTVKTTPEPEVLDTAWELAWPKARFGNAAAQILCAMVKSVRDEFVEALQWFTLATAQGEASAQWVPSASFRPRNKFSVEPSILKCFYWIKQAALQKNPSAQTYLPVLANKITKIVRSLDFAKP